MPIRVFYNLSLLINENEYRAINFQITNFLRDTSLTYSHDL